MSVALHSGGCRCGAVRFEASGEPLSVGYCHCSDCRRATGAPVSAFVGFRAEDVSLTGETLRIFENGAVIRSFCNVCGSPIAYLDQRLEGGRSSCSAPWTAPPTIRRLHAYAASTAVRPCPTSCPDIPRPASET